MKIISSRRGQSNILMLDTSVVQWLDAKGLCWNHNNVRFSNKGWNHIQKIGDKLHKHRMVHFFMCFILLFQHLNIRKYIFILNNVNLHMQIFMPLHRGNHWYLGALDKNKNQFQILDSAFWEVNVSEYEIATSNLVWSILTHFFVIFLLQRLLGSCLSAMIIAGPVPRLSLCMGDTSFCTL
jgi:hypothetical protein